MINSRRTARAVGALMLAAFILYGVGHSLATTNSAGAFLFIGAVMMLLNSVTVVAIGSLMLSILRPLSIPIAVAYLATRIFEGTFLAVGGIGLLVGDANVNFLAYNLAMSGLGIGSLFFCVALYRSSLVPRSLAVWGFIGYAAIAAGCLLELAAVAGAGLTSTIPGGLFELFFAIWLIVRGFGGDATGNIVAAQRPVAE